MKKIPKMKCIWGWVLFLLFCTSGFCPAQDDLVLVRDGKAVSEIVTGKSPTKSASLGALELQYHIRKMTGAELAILESPSGKMPTRIFVGEPPDGIKPEYIGEKSIRRFTGNDIVLTGNDTTSPGKVDYHDVSTFPLADVSREYGYNGPLFSVYDFLEDLCGIRFFFMNDEGTAYPLLSTLKVKRVDREHTSPFDAFRMIAFSRNRDVSLAGSPRDLALCTLRWRMGQFFGRTNHNGYSIYFTYWGKALRDGLRGAFREQRREYFAQGYDGQGPAGDPIIRKNYPDDKDCPAQLCYSNPGTIRYFAEEALIYANGGCVRGGWLNFSGHIQETTALLPRFKGKPFYYPLEPGDSGKNKVCLCPECRKRVKPGAENISDHKFRFISDVAREIAKNDPQAGISTLAYGRSLSYPQETVLADNISVQLCLPIYSWWHPVAYTKQHSAYKKWVEKEGRKRPLTLWLYMFTTHYDADVHFGKYKPFPGFYPAHTTSLMKEFASDGIRGWFTEIRMEYNFMEGYLAARISYDPSIPEETLLSDYYSKCYGKAADSVRAFYDEIEKAYWNPDNCPKEWLKDRNVLIGPKGVKSDYWSTGLWSRDVNWKLGTPERMKKLNTILERAEKEVDTPQGKYMLAKLRKIWNTALEGHAKFYDTARRNTSRSLETRAVEGANGNPEKIEWGKFPVSEPFTDAQGDPVRRNAVIQSAADKDFIYFRFFENTAPDMKEPDIARDGVDFAFSQNGSFPVMHISIGAAGKSIGSKFIMESDVRKRSAYDFDAKIISRPGKDSWTCYIAFPREKIPVCSDTVTLNVFRNRLGQDCSVWNAAGTFDYLDNLQEAGSLCLLPYTIRSQYFIYKNDLKTRNEKDAASGDGHSGSMDFGYSWGMQIFPPPVFKGKYDVDLFLRTDELPGDMTFPLIVYDLKQKKLLCSRKIKAASVSGKSEFVRLEFKDIPLGPDTYMCIGSFNRKLESKGKIRLEKVVIK